MKNEIIECMGSSTDGKDNERKTRIIQRARCRTKSYVSFPYKKKIIKFLPYRSHVMSNFTT